MKKIIAILLLFHSSVSCCFIGKYLKDRQRKKELQAQFEKTSLLCEGIIENDLYKINWAITMGAQTRGWMIGGYSIESLLADEKLRKKLFKDNSLPYQHQEDTRPTCQK